MGKIQDKKFDVKMELIKQFYNVYSNSCTETKVYIHIASLLKVAAFFQPSLGRKTH
jgi:hypothetical protein